MYAHIYSHNGNVTWHLFLWKWYTCNSNVIWEKDSVQIHKCCSANVEQ